MKLRWLGLLLAALCCVSARGQAQDADVFAPVPADLGASLAERLKLLVEYQRTQQWEEHYDLLSVTSTQGESKAEYAQRNRRWYAEVVPEDLILGFTPRATTVREPSANAGWWTIYGCATLRQKGRVVALSASVDAHREGGNWYFLPVGVVTPIDGQPKPCPHSGTAARPSSLSEVAREKKARRGRQH